MRDVQCLSSLYREARDLELWLLRKYFEGRMNAYANSQELLIAKLIIRAQARIDRRHHAYLGAWRENSAELEKHWPSLEGMPDGVDVFSHLPISGKPAGEE